jgi:MFS family permease
MEVEGEARADASWADKGREALQQSADRYRALGAYPDARRLIAAATGSYIGSEFNFIALLALSYQFADSALGVGGVFVAASAPRLLAQGPAGALVDRFTGPRLLMLTQALLAVIAAGYLLLLVMPSLWLLYGLVAAAAFVRTVDTPAFEVRLMSLVPPPQRGAANALHLLAMSVSGLIGPLLGGIVLGLFGAAPLFIVNSLSFLGVVAALATIRPSLSATVTLELEAEAEPERSKIGYLDLLRRPDVALYSAISLTSSLLGVTTLAILVVRAEELGLGESGLGLFFSVAALGSIVGGVAAGGGAYDGPRAFAIAAMAAAIGTVSIVLFGVTGGVLVAFAALALSGIVGPLEEIASITAFQNLLPEGVFGRAFSLFLMAGAAGGLLGGIVGPLLTEAVGVGASLAFLAVPDLILIGLFAWFAGDVRDRFALTAAPALEPEVAGHVMFRRPARRPARPRAHSAPSPLLPRFSRYA